MTVRRLSADVDSRDPVLYRQIRLDALSTDPGAFASTYEREVAFDDSVWRARLRGFGERSGVTLVDEIDDVAVATASIGFTEWDPAPMIMGMWVRPKSRGTGAARRLIDECAAWAREQGSESVVLWVVRANAAAIALYTSCDFSATGLTDTLPSDPDVKELEMRLQL